MKSATPQNFARRQLMSMAGGAALALALMGCGGGFAQQEAPQAVGTTMQTLAGFRPITECGTTSSVTTHTFRSRLSETPECGVLVLSGGNYGNLTLSNRSSGVLTIRCATQYGCEFETITVSNVNGLILDGIKMNGSNIQLTIEASRNILVKNSSFANATATGILLKPGTPSVNVQIESNTFSNSALGCHPDGSPCYHLSDGTVIASMDYGVRIYDGEGVRVRGNTFGTVFNHAISLKSGSTTSALIDDNTFNACGRTCIELGQEPTEVTKEAFVTNNTFRGLSSGKSLVGVLMKNIQRATICHNDFDAGGNKAISYEDGPSGRVVTVCDNTH